MNTPVSIIIPVWNLWDMTQACLRSIAEHSDIEEIQVVVVDNGSTDATGAALPILLQELFGKNGVLVRHEENLGFACACNAGARAAAHPLLFFLNNDTILTPGWLPPLKEALQAPRMGMVGPLLLYPGNDRVQHCGISLTPGMEVTHIYNLFPQQTSVISNTRYVQAITGAAILVPASLFFACGGFFEGYRNGFEDLDLCCMIRRQGLRMRCVPQSVIYHLTSQTPGRFDHDAPNARLLFERTAGSFVPDMHKIAIADGFVPHLGPGMHFYLSLPEAQEQALTEAFGKNFHADRCRERLNHLPLWQGGYTLLAQYLEQQHAWSEACDIRTLQAHFFPLPAYAVALARCATRAGETTLATQAAEAARSVSPSERERIPLTQKAQQLRALGEEKNDTAIIQLYADWLRLYATPNTARA